jgi:glucan phosphoethanolaminetransferase (alkaline phosphatase superfamily)
VSVERLLDTNSDFLLNHLFNRCCTEGRRVGERGPALTAGMKSLLGLLLLGLTAIAVRICDYSACGCSIVEVVLTTGLAVEYLTTKSIWHILALWLSHILALWLGLPRPSWIGRPRFLAVSLTILLASVGKMRTS